MYEVFHGDKQRVEDRLSGAGSYGPFPTEGLPVGGLTLIFTTPAATVTFGGAANSMRTWKQILSEIVAQGAGVLAKTRPINNGPNYSGTAAGGAPSGNLELVMQKDAGIVISNLGTANTLLKIKTDAPTTFPALVAQAKIAGFSQGSTPAHYAVLINLT